MRRLSSRATFWYKRVFPIVWFGFLAVFTGAAFFTGSAGNPIVLLVPVVMVGVGYSIMKKFIFDLVDEVDDDGDALVVRNGGRSDRIALSDVMNVNYSPLVNPPRVTLTLRKPSVFGNQVSFCAPLRLLMPFATHPVIDGLIRRIDAHRGHSSAASQRR